MYPGTAHHLDKYTNKMEYSSEETRRVAENLRQTVHLLHEHPHLQDEQISSALNPMYGDVKHHITMVRLSRISRQVRRKAKTLHKGLSVMKEEARAVIEEVVDQGCQTPMQVAIELRRKGYEGQWMRPSFVKHIVKYVQRKKRRKEHLHCTLRNAGKGVPDRFGRPIKSKAEIMSEMLPDFCNAIPTQDIGDCEYEFQAAMRRMEDVAW